MARFRLDFVHVRFPRLVFDVDDLAGKVPDPDLLPELVRDQPEATAAVFAEVIDNLRADYLARREAPGWRSAIQPGVRVFNAHIGLEGQVLKIEEGQARVWWSDDDVSWEHVSTLELIDEPDQSTAP